MIELLAVLFVIILGLALLVYVPLMLLGLLLRGLLALIALPFKLVGAVFGVLAGAAAGAGTSFTSTSKRASGSSSDRGLRTSQSSALIGTHRSRLIRMTPKASTMGVSSSTRAGIGVGPGRSSAAT